MCPKYSSIFLFTLVVCQYGVNAIFDVGNKKCQRIFEKESEDEGTGCVKPGSVPTVNKKCARCAFDYQCESGWCHHAWKLCYKQGNRCSTRQAWCQNCTSSRGSDLSLCNCTNPDFPNNWVECTDGSGGVDSYKIRSQKEYVRKDIEDGSLKSSDLFARYSQCYHNEAREAIGLPPLRWNSELALYATNWVKHLKETNECRIYHSSYSDRKDVAGFWAIGENLMVKPFPEGVANTQIPRLGFNALNGWFGELVNFQYAGPDAGSGVCPLRNLDLRQTPIIGHLTQVLWATTTDIGCDYAICEGTEGQKSYATVSCVYGPAGNVAGKAPFNDTIYCNLNNNENLLNNYGGQVPRCDGKFVDCDNMDNWIQEPEEIPEAVPEEVPRVKDGICITKKGRTCSFPWTKPGFGVFESCQDAVDRRGKPHCWTLEEKWDVCPDDSDDPDCFFEMPQEKN